MELFRKYGNRSSHAGGRRKGRRIEEATQNDVSAMAQGPANRKEGVGHLLDAVQNSLADLKQDVQAAKTLSAAAPANLDSSMVLEARHHDKILAIRPAASRGPMLPMGHPQERRLKRLEGRQQQLLQELAAVKAAPKAGLSTDVGLALLLTGMRAAQGLQRTPAANSRALLASHPVHLDLRDDRGRIAALEAAMAELLAGGGGAQLQQRGQQGALVPRGHLSRGVRAEDLDRALERLAHVEERLADHQRTQLALPAPQDPSAAALSDQMLALQDDTTRALARLEGQVLVEGSSMANVRARQHRLESSLTVLASQLGSATQASAQATAAAQAAMREKAEALAAEIGATGSAVASVAADQDSLSLELRATQSALERLGALVGGLRAAGDIEKRVKALEAAAAGNAVALQADLEALQVELEGLQAEPALARNAWAQQVARVSNLSAAVRASEKLARAHEETAESVKAALGGIGAKVEGLEGLLLRWAEAQQDAVPPASQEAVEQLAQEQARLSAAQEAAGEGLSGVAADVDALRAQFMQDSAKIAAEMGAKVEALSAMVANADAQHSAQLAALAAGVAERAPKQAAALAGLERRAAEMDARLGQVAGALQSMTQAAEQQQSQLRRVEGALTNVDASVQARPELKGGEAMHGESLKRLSSQLAAMRNVGMAGMLSMLERMEARMASAADKDALSELWQELQSLAAAQDRAGESLSGVARDVRQEATRTGSVEAALRAVAAEQDAQREGARALRAEGTQLAARLEALAARVSEAAAAGAPGRAAAAAHLERRVAEMDDALGQLAGAVKDLGRETDGHQSQLRLVQDTLRLVDSAVQALKSSDADHGELLQKVGPLCQRASSLESAMRALAAEQDAQREAVRRLHAEGTGQGLASSEGQARLAARVESLAAVLAQAGAQHSADLASLAAGAAGRANEQAARASAAEKLERRVADIDGELGHVGQAVRDIDDALQALKGKDKEQGDLLEFLLGDLAATRSALSARIADLRTPLNGGSTMGADVARFEDALAQVSDQVAAAHLQLVPLAQAPAQITALQKSIEDLEKLHAEMEAVSGVAAALAAALPAATEAQQTAQAKMGQLESTVAGALGEAAKQMQMLKAATDSNSTRLEQALRQGHS